MNSQAGKVKWHLGSSFKLISWCLFVRMPGRRVRAKTGMSQFHLSPECGGNAQSRQWVFFSTFDVAPFFDKDLMQFLVYQRECHPHTGKHWQGYVEFKARQRVNRLGNMFGYPMRAGVSNGVNSGGHANHFQARPRFGSQDEAIRYVTSVKYCRKCHAGDAEGLPRFAKACLEGCTEAADKYKVEATVVYGEPGMELQWSGARNEDILRMIKAGKTRLDVFDKHPGYAQNFHRWIEKQFLLYGPKRNFQPGVFWLYGASGSGKSRLARAVCTSHYLKSPDNKWFDGYDQQEVVIVRQ